MVMMLVPSPTTAKLAYQKLGERHATQGVYVARDDGSHPRVVAQGTEPEISPDGRSVVFARPHGDDFDLAVVSTKGGRARRLMRRYVSCICRGIPELGVVWSPDSRYVVAQNASNGVVELIDVANGTKRELPFDSGKPSFSPDATRIVGPYGQPGLAVYNIRLRRLRQVSNLGDGPAWSRTGLAVETEQGIKLKQKLAQPGRLVKPRTGSESFRYAVDWTASGDKLLTAGGPNQFSLKAFVISPASGSVVTLPATFSEVDAISRRGHWVLGAIGGDVVAMRPNGERRILANNALSPSWTK
jgi:hypothetical protein